MTVTKTGRPPGLSENIIRIRTQQLQAQQQQAQKLQSEYQQAYKSWPWQAPRKIIKPQTKTKTTNNPLPANADMRTTNQRAFVPHKPQRKTASHAPKREYNKDKTKMLTDTTYEIDYTRKDASRRLPYRPKPDENPVAPSGKPVNTVTAYEATYVRWTPQEQKDCKTEVKVPKDNLNVLRVRFEGTSTVQTDFKPHENVPPAKSMRPQETSYTSSSPFQDQTTHQADFAPKPPQELREPFKPKEEYRRPSSTTTTGRYDYLSIMKRDFPEHIGQKPHMNYKPRQEYRPTGGKFDDNTTQRLAYKAWPIPRKEKHPWAERPAYNSSHRAKLRLQTSYQDDYIDPSTIMPEGLDNCRPAPCRYENNLGAGESGPFDDRTEYKCTFVAWEGVKRAATYKVIEEYAPPKTPFIGESTFRSHFKGERAPPAKSCRPLQRPHSSTGSFIHSQSTYCNNFRRPVSCPAMEIFGLDDPSDHETEDNSGSSSEYTEK